MIAAVDSKDQVDFQPLWDQVLVEPINPRETAGGLALPDNHEPEELCGKVVAVGPGRYDGGQWIDVPVLPGDVVYLTFQGPLASVTMNRKKYLIVRAAHIAGKKRSK